MQVPQLLRGETPDGLVGSRLQLTLSPGQSVAFREPLPPTATSLGVVADFYRAPGGDAGHQKLVVDARCGFFAPKVVLSQNDLLLP